MMRNKYHGLMLLYATSFRRQQVNLQAVAAGLSDA